MNAYAIEAIGLVIIATPFVLWRIVPRLFAMSKRRRFCEQMMEKFGIDPRRHDVVIADAPKDRRFDKDVVAYRTVDRDGTAWLQWKGQRLIATDPTKIVLMVTTIQATGFATKTA